METVGVCLFVCSGAVGPHFLGCSWKRFDEDEVNCISAARLSGFTPSIFIFN